MIEDGVGRWLICINLDSAEDGQGKRNQQRARMVGRAGGAGVRFSGADVIDTWVIKFSATLLLWTSYALRCR